MPQSPRRWDIVHAAVIGATIGLLLELNLIHLGDAETLQDVLFGVAVFTVLAIALCWLRNRMLGFR